MPAPFGADQEQIRDVRAGDQQDGSEGAHYYPQGAADVADQALLQIMELRGEPHVFKCLDGQTGLGRETVQSDRNHAGDVRGGLFDSDAWFEARDSWILELA